MSTAANNQFYAVLKWVLREQVGIIGIYGNGGVGKTTLLRRIHDELTNKYYRKNFDILIWVTISQEFILASVQNQIWRRIGLFDHNWVEKSVGDKAKNIYDILSQNKFVLFLDDTWDKIDLEMIGVPFPYPGSENGSKVIISTRSEHICHAMGADKVTRVEALDRESAWQLFDRMVGEHTLMSDQTILQLAKGVSEKCHGLPILLRTVARAMACRETFDDWKNAVKELEIISASTTEGTEVFSLLKFCYDSLPNDIIKSCFLYFSLFPEDFTILKNDLIDLWISEEFLCHYENTRDDSLNLGNSIVDTLIGACLLEEENHSVKMLDVIRDSALHIASLSGILNNARLIAASDVRNLKGVGRMVSMQHSIQDQAILPLHLLTFFSLYNPFIVIRGDFFQFMEALTVLDLSHTCIEKVPRAISRFVSLQHLNLSHTCIEWLPEEFMKLLKLRCLNLEHNDQLRVISKNMISSLSALQVLRMFRCGFSVQEIEDNIMSATNMNIDEVLHLEHLKVLSITITCATALQQFFSSHNLASCTEALSLECFWGLKSIDISPLAYAEHLVTLEIHHAEHLKELSVGKRSFNSLRAVRVENCSSLRDLTWLILAPNLVALRVAFCGDMEELISIRQLGEFQNISKNFHPLGNLEVFELECLPKLKSIYWNKLEFRYLKKFEVSDCPLLKS